MVKLAVGDHVMDLAGSHDGKLVDIDGETGYVLQMNGVEIEFPLGRLKPYQASKVAEVRTLSGLHRDTLLSPVEKTLLASIPAEISAAVARSYDSEPGMERPAFAALPESKRLEVVRIYLPSLPQRLLMAHTKLVVAMRDLKKAGR